MVGRTCFAQQVNTWREREDRCFVSEKYHNNSLHHPHHFYYHDWSGLAGWFSALSCHPEFCSHYRKSQWLLAARPRRAGSQVTRIIIFCPVTSPPHRHKPNGKNKICESLMCFLTVCIYNLQICWSWSWNTTSHVEGQQAS